MAEDRTDISIEIALARRAVNSGTGHIVVNAETYLRILRAVRAACFGDPKQRGYFNVEVANENRLVDRRTDDD